MYVSDQSHDANVHIGRFSILLCRFASMEAHHVAYIINKTHIHVFVLILLSFLYVDSSLSRLPTWNLIIFSRCHLEGWVGKRVGLHYNPYIR